MSIRKMLKQIYIINYLYNKFKKGIDYTKFFRQNRYKNILKTLKMKEQINIVFLLYDISQWKSEVLYKLFDESEKYNPKIIILSDNSTNIDNIYLFFKDKNYDVSKGYDTFNKQWIDINTVYKPDIVFFSRAISAKKSIYGLEYFTKSLICYIPYSFFTDKNTFLQTGTLFHKKLWKYFVPTEFNKVMALEEYGSDNIVVTDGYPGCDLFLGNNNNMTNPWMSDNRKKIIWAPHHTIEEISNAPYFSTFLIYNSFMLELSQKYNNEIQICFKPHPGLKDKLYNHKDWGIEKTDKYYNKWNKLNNTFLAEGSYQELFIYSDAMILDSVSFLAEYLYLNKPYCFLTRNDKGSYSDFLNKIGLVIFPVVYKAKNKDELNSFFQDQIISGNDSLKSKRLKIINKDLKIDFDTTASEKIFNDITFNIFRKEN